MQICKKIFSGLMITAALGFAVPASAGLPDGKSFPSLLSSLSDAPVMRRTADSIYNLVGLGSYGLERDVFFAAFKGLQYFNNKGLIRKSNLLTICDYSQSSNNKRLYVVDVLNSRLLFNTYVSHGKNSGDEYATSFSNHSSSNKSSLGFMITAETYSGKAGLSMRFNGMESGINDRVRSRDIVLHGSRFVNESIMNIKGTIGKSLGCPAVPYGVHNRIIDVIKGGSVFYIHHNDMMYARTSPVLNANFDMEANVPALVTESNEVPVIQAGSTLTIK